MGMLCSKCPHSAPQTRRRVNTTVARGSARLGTARLTRTRRMTIEVSTPSPAGTPEAPAARVIIVLEKAHQRSARARGRQDRGRRHPQGGPPLTISFRPLLPFFDARIPTRTFDATCDATDPPRAAHASAPPAERDAWRLPPLFLPKSPRFALISPPDRDPPPSLLSINRSHGSRMTSRSIRVSSSPSARSNS